MPMGYDGMRTDDNNNNNNNGNSNNDNDGGGGGERTDNPDDYKRICIDFIEEISDDYKAWVDYYQLPADEDKKRRGEIDATIVRSNKWIAKVATSIKSIDVVMNDGLQKMAESTAGKPFQIGVFVNNQSSYVSAKPGIIDVNVKAAGREGRKTKLGSHFKDSRFRIESTCNAFLDETGLPQGEYDMMDVHLKLHAEEAVRRDVISFTVIVVETEDGNEYDKRGVSTIVHIV